MASRRSPGATRAACYTLFSEHLSPPLNYRKVLLYLKQELGSLALVSPTRSTCARPAGQGLAGAAAGVLGAGGALRGFVDHLASSPPNARRPAAPKAPEQHLLQGSRSST